VKAPYLLQSRVFPQPQSPQIDCIHSAQKNVETPDPVFNRPGYAGTFYDFQKKERKEPKELEVTLSYFCWSRPRYGVVLIPPEMRHAGSASEGHSVLDTVFHDMAPKKIVKPTGHVCSRRKKLCFVTGTGFSPYVSGYKQVRL
jgi:hypothetical protein